VIIDASVGVKWLISEADDDLAEALLTRVDLAAPDLLRLEIAHLLGKLHRRGEVSARFSREAWSELDEIPLSLHPTGEFIEVAFDLSLRLGAAVYDCVYLAMAETTDDVVVTADERFARAVRQAGSRELAGRLRTLSELR
jgi:predicted nucleic acid-binding protein